MQAGSVISTGLLVHGCTRRCIHALPLLLIVYDRTRLYSYPPKMRRISAAGIVLRTQELAEADLIVTLLAREIGKVRAAAKNARKSKQRFPGGIDLFDCARFDLEEPRPGKELFNMMGAGEKVIWGKLRESIHKFTAAAYLADLTDTVIQEATAEGEALFELLYHTFNALNSSSTIEEARMLLAFYTVQLFERGGWGTPDSQDPKAAEWLAQMSRERTPILPHDPQIGVRGLSLLLSFGEQVIGRRLRTIDSLIGTGLV